ncbi:hypothetical protein AbauAttikon1_0031 [Acinetobacter phage Abau_Attikon1]
MKTDFSNTQLKFTLKIFHLMVMSFMCQLVITLSQLVS